MAYVKKHAIRNLQGATAAQDIDDNFDAIFATLRALQNQIGGLNTTVIVSSSDADSGAFVPGLQGADGEDGPPGPPGLVGPAGAAGAQGPTGPVTIGPMGIDGYDGDDGYPLPGPRGETGATGATGPVGPPTLGPMSLMGEDGEDGWPIPGPAGPAGEGAGPVTLIEARTCTGNATEGFTGLADYDELWVLCRNVTQSSSGQLSLRVSIDNGANYLSTSSDYIPVTSAGLEGSATSIPFHNTAATAARSELLYIPGLSLNGSPKWVNNAVTQTGQIFILPTTSPITAVQVLSTGAGNLSGGVIHVFGR